MKRLLTCVFMFVLLMEIVYAGEIFNSDVKDNVPFTINGITHIARYYPSAKKVSMLAGTDRVLVAVEDCENIGGMKYCIDSAEEGINEETGDPASTMRLRVLQSGPEIDIDRSISEDEPGLNEEVVVTVTLTNVGNERATNVNYVDKFPDSVKVSSTYYDIITNGVSWAGSINVGASQVITYKLRFQDFITYESAGEASFIFNSKVNKVKSGTATFEVQKPYKLSDSISAKSVDVGEDITYSLNISGLDAAQDLNINKVEIALPEGSTVSYRDMGLDAVGNKVTYSGKISGEGSKVLSFRFRSSKVAQGKLVTNIDLRVGQKSFAEKFEHDVGFGVSAITPEITFSTATVKGGRELEIEAKITNNGEDTISDISLDMTGDIVEPSGWRKLELEPGKKHYAFNKIINAPAIDEEKTYFIKLSGSYARGSGKTMKFEATKEVTVLPQEKLVELSPVFRVDGKEVNVTLNVKNVAPYKISYVSLIDTFPKGFQVTAGSRDIDIEELGIGEERIAYSYVVKVPGDYKKDTFEIAHIFNGLNKDEEKVMTEKKSTVVIGAAAASGAGAGEEEEEANTTESGSNETGGEETGAETGEAEEKPGIFTRMWHWIKGLFSKNPAEEDKFE
ncbi:hypothetical protein JW898_01505 [Candidatus Woesearchaeota archaeon]|nr:hypothetical protein [Candidatus Woesearchaeota archaeon]